MALKPATTPARKLFKHLKLARVDGSYLKELERVRKQDLFILDDLDLEPFDAHRPSQPIEPAYKLIQESLICHIL